MAHPPPPLPPPFLSAGCDIADACAYTDERGEAARLFRERAGGQVNPKNAFGQPEPGRMPAGTSASGMERPHRPDEVGSKKSGEVVMLRTGVDA